jgi:LPS-assembly lipoprotein
MHAPSRALWPGLVAALLLSACGFQLQGRHALSPQLQRVEVRPADRHSDFTRALRRSLDGSGAQLVSVAGPDEAVVRILVDRFTEKVLSVDARNIPTDYELAYEVEVEVRRGQEALMPAEPFVLTRIFSYDERRQLAKEREKDVLREALARDLASVVMRRLASL